MNPISINSLTFIWPELNPFLTRPVGPDDVQNVDNKFDLASSEGAVNK